MNVEAWSDSNDAECFRHLADVAPAMLWIVDANYQCTFVNQGWCEFTGQSEAQAHGYGWFDAIHPADRAPVALSFRDASAVAESYQGEFRLRAAQGDYRWVVSSARPRRGPDGAPAGYVGSLIDIHEAKTAREELRRTKELLEAVLEATPDLVYATDRQGRIILANRSSLNALGLPAERVVGHRTEELIAVPSERERIVASDARVIASGKGELIEEQVTTAAGTQTYLSAKSPLRDERGEVVGMVGISRPMDARPRIEEISVAEEAVCRDLDEEFAPLAWLADPDGSIFWFNRTWSAFTGMGTDVMRGWRWMTLVHPDHQGRLRQKINGCLSTGEVWEDTFPMRGRDGRYRWFLSRGGPIRGEGGEIVRWFGTITDVTEHHRIEESLMEAGRRKDEFLATLAHELRNPLAPIRHGVELIRMREPDDPELMELVEIIDRQSSTLTRLVDDLLEVSGITRGKIPLRVDRLRIGEVVDTAVEAAGPVLDARGHDFVVEVPEGDVWVDGDATRLAQVLTNLLTNAAKYTPSGGVVRLRVGVEAGQVCLRVRDNGVGISSEDRARVFDMFSQVGKRDDRTPGGLGIGLALVHGLVALHGGTVAVDSAGEGQGSEFVVRLPEAQALVEEPASSGERRQRRGRREASAEAKVSGKILIVDDNVDAAKSLERLLRWSGHTTRVAHDGLEAVQAFAEFAPAVVLLDIGLPSIDGYEVARRIRAMEGGERVTLIAQTGWGMERDRQLSREAGFDHHLTKPVDLEELTALVARGLEAAG